MLAWILAASWLPIQAPAPKTSFSPTRYAIGQRMIRMETAWIRASDSRKDLAVPAVNSAVAQFFMGQLTKAALGLDSATAVLSDHPVTPQSALDFRIVPPLVAPGAPIVVRATWAYLPDQAAPFQVKVNGETVTATPGTPFEVRLNDATGTVGDRQIEVKAEGFARPVAYSVVRDWTTRRDRIAKSNSTEANDLVRLIERSESSLVENDVLANRILGLAESLAQGQSLRSLGELPWGSYEGALFRAEWPTPLPPTPVVVIALHGAGGSENLFFDGYGQGLAPRLAKERGWIFIAPRSAPSSVDLMTKWVTSRLGVTPRAIFTLGHSMGGAMALRTSTPPLGSVLFAPAASSIPEPLRGVPTLLSVGTSEVPFLVKSANQCREQLTSPLSRLVIKPHCDHLMVVAEVLPEAFAFLDQVLRESGRD